MTLSCSHIVVYRRVSIVLPFIHSLVHVSQNKFNKMSNPEMAFGDLDGANFAVIFLHFFCPCYWSEEKTKSIFVLVNRKVKHGAEQFDCLYYN